GGVGAWGWALLLGQRRGLSLRVHVDDDERAADAELAVARDLERPGDRRLAEPFRADPHLDLVLEHEHLEELRLDLPARVAPPVLDQPELPPDRRLRHLGHAESGR